MFANRFPALLQGLLTLAGMAFAALLLAGGAHAAGLTVLVADELAAHTEFVRLLRESQEAGSRFDLVRLGGPAPELASAVEDRVTAGVRTRGMRPSAPADMPVTMAVGAVAACVATARRADGPGG